MRHWPLLVKTVLLTFINGRRHLNLEKNKTKHKRLETNFCEKKSKSRMKRARCWEDKTEVVLCLFKQLWIFVSWGKFPSCCSEHLNFDEGDACVILPSCRLLSKHSSLFPWVFYFGNSSWLKFSFVWRGLFFFLNRDTVSVTRKLYFFAHEL